MRTKNLVESLSCLLLASTMTSCGEPEQKFAVSVTNENGEPIENVEVKAWFKLPRDNGGIQDYAESGLTNAQGRIDLIGRTVWAPTSVEARKEGYYRSMEGNHWTISRGTDNRWEPWPVEVNFVMKEIVNPMPMYVAKFDGHQWLPLPEKELGPFGFDLMIGDWMRPHGEGKVADFVLEAHRENPDDTTTSPKGNVILTFSNPGDGIFKLLDEGSSILVGPSMAPQDGFEGRFDFINWRDHPTQGGMISRSFPNEVYAFRVRSKLDEDGNVESAYYGKLHGRIVGWLPQAVPSILMTYYLNGTPNDRGLEWDMKTNLIQDTSRMRVPDWP